MSESESKRERSKKKSRRARDSETTTPQDPEVSALEQKKADDLEERLDMEKHVSKLIQDMHALQERMYTIRFDDSVDPEDKQLELKNFATELLRLEKALIQAHREELEVFEDQLDLHQIGLENLLDPTLHQADFEDANTAAGAFMRTPSTQSVQGQEPRKKWQSMFKMFKERKDQVAVAQGQYVASRRDITNIDEDIQKLRSAVLALRNRKNLNPRDQRTLDELQEQLRLRVAQKERMMRLSHAAEAD